jgi:hypothetical protein
MLHGPCVEFQQASQTFKRNVQKIWKLCINHEEVIGFHAIHGRKFKFSNFHESKNKRNLNYFKAIIMVDADVLS